MQRHGVRAGWTAIPLRIRQEIDEIAGSPIESITPLQGGFSPGPAARCELADGRRVFVKAGGTSLNPDTPVMHRREAEILGALPSAHPSPMLLGVADDGDWIAIVVSWIDGRMPTAPLGRDDVDRLLALTNRLARAGEGVDVHGLGSLVECHPNLAGHWRDLAAGDAVDIDRLDPWSRRHLDALVDLEALGPAAASGGALAHLDLRSDNVLFSPRGRAHDVVVDWPAACRAAPWVDLVTMLPTLHLDGGPDPHDAFATHPLARHAEPDAVTAFIAMFSGFFTRMALQPHPPGLPTLRPFQAAQGRIARAWLRARTGFA